MWFLRLGLISSLLILASVLAPTEETSGAGNPGLTDRSFDPVSPSVEIRLTAGPVTAFTDLSFNPPSPSAAEEVVIRACTNGVTGVTLRVSVNTARDGSANGAWNIIKELGVPCFNEIDAPRWRTLEYADGTHRVRAEARQGDEPWANATVAETTYVLNHRRPASPHLSAPTDNQVLDRRTVTFRWGPTTNARRYRLRVSANPDPASAPILDKTLRARKTAFTHTFGANHAQLYWKVTATNDLGSNDSGVLQFSIQTP